LGKNLDGGKVVCRANIRTLKNYFSNVENIYLKTNEALQCAFVRISEGDNLAEIDNTNSCVPYTGLILRQPSSFRYIQTILSQFLISWLSRLAIQNIYKRFFYDDNWRVAVSREIETPLLKWTYINSSIAHQNWLADPFLLRTDRQTYLLYEEFDQLLGKGRISYSVLDAEKSPPQSSITYSGSRLLLETPTHLSYPYTFEKDGRFFFIPENGNNGCNLYEITEDEAIEGKLKAKKIKKILSGKCVDPSYIRLRDTDYLFLTGWNDDSPDLLRVFISSDILSDELIEHQCSPILVSNILGRSAGRILMIDDYSCLRPSQISINTYGEGIAFTEFRVSRTSISYRTTTTRLFSHKSAPFSNIHHLDFQAEIMALDLRLRPRFFT